MRRSPSSSTASGTRTAERHSSTSVTSGQVPRPIAVVHRDVGLALFRRLAAAPAQEPQQQLPLAWGAKTQSERQKLFHLQGMIESSHPYAVDAAAALCRRRRLRESPPTSRETPHSNRCAITLSMMPYSFASSAVMK